METRARTLVKAILWSLLGLVTMSLVGLALTGSAMLGGGMAAINTGIGLVLYLIYERVWTLVRWGRNV
ncbi:DUF2061 domain-containing protein [Thalassovita taeanensis]|uniref:Predicted membrane protein n=1 Tax=Thalassovita taeanensis TaxID=657014 RepID=A0A1H9EQR7_9RHOB|nr:DUF2061 domain-containing protein [Thalassovita taeanensis]SEQ27348.1 Predicted membrane protein [Thalassovita taeanensis]